MLRRSLIYSLFEVWTVLIGKLSKEERKILIDRKKILISKYISVLKEVEFEDSITKGTNDKKAVSVRFERIEKLLAEVIKDVNRKN